jgi:hypothetical protein
MNRSDLREMKSYAGYPCLTITLPTHRTSPDNKQDPIRVRNLVIQATNRLLESFARREVAPLLDGIERIASEIDYAYTLDGLAIFVNSEIARKFYLPFTLAERVVIDQDFYTRDLVFAMNRTPRYWVLALSEQPTRLYEAVRNDLVEVSAGSRFPLTHEGPGGASGLPNDPAINSSAFRDEHHRIFFRDVDQALGELMADDPLPLAVVGVDRYLAFFREVSSHGDKILATLTGSHDRTSAHELGHLVWPLVKEALAARRQAALAELDAAVGGQRSASTIGEAWRFAQEGRGAVLLVEEGFHYPARVNASGTGLEPVETPSGPEEMDDAVDETVETVLNKGGRVVFFEDGTLAQHGRIALILRY